MNLLSYTADQVNDLGITAYKVTEAKKWNDDLPVEQRKQLTDDGRTGWPMWDVLATFAEGETVFQVKVRMPAETRPDIHAGPIRFGGLNFRARMIQGRLGLAVTADTYSQETAPSVKRTAPPVPAGSAA